MSRKDLRSQTAPEKAIVGIKLIMRPDGDDLVVAVFPWSDGFSGTLHRDPGRPNRLWLVEAASDTPRLWRRFVDFRQTHFVRAPEAKSSGLR